LVPLEVNWPQPFVVSASAMSCHENVPLSRMMAAEPPAHVIARLDPARRYFLDPCPLRPDAVLPGVNHCRRHLEPTRSHPVRLDARLVYEDAELRDLRGKVVQLVKLLLKRRYLDSPHRSFWPLGFVTYFRQMSSSSISTTEDLASNGLGFLP
jgi:hypothetical protein